MLNFKAKNKKQKSDADLLIESNVERYSSAVTSLRDMIAPSGLVINTTSIKLGNTFCRTLFILTYPRYLNPG